MAKNSTPRTNVTSGKAKDNLTDFEERLLAFEAKLPPTPREQMLRVAAAFLTVAHTAKGRQLKEAKKLWARLHSRPGLIDELRKRSLIEGELKAP